MDIIAESIRDDMRLFAEAIAGQSDTLHQHDKRITRLEERRN